MHLDLHAIRSAVNQLEQLSITTVDCREAGLTESESLEQVRHVIHQWKTPFRAPYAGGSSFLQLILLRHALQHALENAPEAPAAAPQPAAAPVIKAAEPEATAQAEKPAPPAPDEELVAVPVTEDAPPAQPASPDLISQAPSTQESGGA